MVNHETRKIVRARHCVIHVRAGKQLAVAVVKRMLPKGLAHALGYAAMDLPVDNHRIDDVSEVVRGGE